MSTTVNYKGNTIATLSNETKTLTTSDKWMEADVIITDASAGIVPSGTITIDNDGTYDVTNYASADVAIDYESKLRAITFIANRNSDDTRIARIITVYQTFDSQIDFSNGIKTIGRMILIPVGDTTKTTTFYVPKSRPIIVIATAAAIGNFDVIIDSSYGECVDVPHILGASSTNYTKAVYLKTNAPDEFTVTINLNSQATYPDTVLLNSLSITSNGTYTATSGTAYSSVNVEVEPNLQSKSNISPTTSSQTITADSGYDGLSSVQINAMTNGTEGTPTATKGTVSNHQVSVTPSVTNAAGYISGGTKTGTAVTVTASELASGNKEISSNGINIDVVGYSTVSVDVPDSTLVVTISYNSSTNRFEPDKTYSEISEANATGKTIAVNCAMTPSIASADGVFSTNKFTYWVREYLDGSEQMLEQEYILNSSGLTKNQEVIYYENAPSVSPSLQAKTNISPTTSSQTITADSGYDGLSSVQINAMPTMTLPSSASSTSSGTSKATISRSISNQYINIPTGYNGTAQYYTISATPNGTVTAPSSISGTAATVSTGTNTLTLTKTVSVTPNVSTAGYISSGTAGNSSVSLTANITTKGATTYNTSTTDQTIASGTYLTGTQTIKAVTISGLDASKILSGTTVMVGDANDADRIASVTGTVTFSTITTSSSNPTGGNNGDVWIKVS